MITGAPAGRVQRKPQLVAETLALNRARIARLQGFLEQRDQVAVAALALQLKHAIHRAADWDRLKFTMDTDMSRAVREAFVRLYEEGLIYRDTRLINWCNDCRTALSDLEVENEETQGEMYEFAIACSGSMQLSCGVMYAQRLSRSAPRCPERDRQAVRLGLDTARGKPRAPAR